MDRSRIVYTSREREYKKSFPRRKAIFILAVFLLFSISGGAVYLLRLPRWQVKNISVEGTETLSQEEITAKAFEFLEGFYAFLIPKRSIIISPNEAFEHFLKKEFLLIASVNVDKEYPDSLKISVKERKLWAIYCVLGAEQFPSTSAGEDKGGGAPQIEKECVYIDDTGFAYEKAPSSSGSLILKIRSDEESISLAAQVIPSEKVEKLRRITEALKQKLGIETAGYELFSKIPGEVRIVTSEGFKIWLKLDDDIERVVKVLKTILDEEIEERRGKLEYIDARFGNKVFYKLRK